MGGEHEKVVETKVGKLRLHVVGSNVHIHDDDKKIKVEIPKATFFNIWSSVVTSQTKKKEKFRDFVRQTMLTVKVKDGDALLQVRKFTTPLNAPTTGSVAKAVNQFMESAK